MLKKLVCLLVLLFFVLFSQSAEPMEQYITTENIETIKVLCQSILTNANTSEEDLVKLNNLFLTWNKEIEALPGIQQKSLNLSRENKYLKIGLIGLCGLVIGEGIYIIARR